MKIKRRESLEEEAVGDYWRASELLRAERAQVLRRSLKLGDPVLMRVQESNEEEFLKKALGSAYDGGKPSNLD